MSKKEKKRLYETNHSIVVVDSNLLLLLLIGQFDKRAIESYSHRLSAYTSQDYDQLLLLLTGKTIIITPNIITEVSNLSWKFNRRKEFFEFLKYHIPTLTESYIQSSQTVVKDTFIKFGITDATIIELSKQGITTLTDDLNLFYYLSSQSYRAINFSWIRGQYLLKNK